MGWTGILFNDDGTVTSVDELHDDWTAPPIGSVHDVQALLERALPGIEWRRPPKGNVYGDYAVDDWAVELSILSPPNTVDSIGVRLMGDGERALRVLAAVCTSASLLLYDNQIGDFVDFDGDYARDWRDFERWKNDSMA